MDNAFNYDLEQQCDLVLDIQVLDAFLAPGSELWMFNDVPEMDRERKLIDGGLDFSRLENITLVHREGNAVIRRHLESLPLESFDSVSSENIDCSSFRKKAVLLNLPMSKIACFFPPADAYMQHTDTDSGR